MTTSAPLPEIDLQPELSLPDAMLLATRMHQHGEVSAAMDIYGRVLAIVPDHADALHFLGIGLHQTGESAEGLRRIEQSIAVVADNPSAHVNRGNILLGLNRLEDTAAAYSRAVELGWDTVELHNNLGVLHRASNRPQEAETSYRKALAIDPDYIETHNNLAGLYFALDRTEEAMYHGWLALASQPLHARSRELVATGLRALGRLEEAANIYREWLQAEPDNPLPRHHLAACTGVGIPARADDDYVEKTFDGFANSFDAKLASLTYRAPELVAHAVALQCGAPQQAFDVLDAGCGTGLCGPHLAPYARSLTGVDLSQQMLDKAHTRALYDPLVKAELTAFLFGQHQRYDLLVSADTLCYFGALEDVAAAGYGALRPDGLLVFTVEASEDDAAAGFVLHPHGRYSHRRDYIERTLAAAGLTGIGVEAVHLRMENFKPVAGWLVTARRPGNAGAPSH